MSLLSQASLILTPNAYKEGKLYSVIPSDGSGDFTFTRATTATRVNSDGLVELVPYNLLTYSEQFDNAAWTKLRGSVMANVITSPSGIQDADKFIEDTTTNTHLVVSGVTLSSASYAMSVFAKAAERTQIALFNSSSTDIAVFDLSNGTIISSGTHTTSIQSIGNGWYRCSIVSTTSTAIRIAIANGGVISYLGDGTSGLFIWGAQLVEGTNALPYQKTETRLNIPRIDSSLGGCPSILLEPQRTNIVTYSEQFDDVSWGKVNGGVGLVPTVTANTAISPSGAQNADRIQLSLNGGTTLADLSYINKAVSSTSAATFSIYAKSNTTPCTIYFRSGTVATAINITTEWQRFDFYNSGAITVVQLGLRGGSYGGAVNSNTADISVWGAQLEAGSYPTSYIPTTTASVTRNVDVLTRNNIYTNGLITASGGTWYFELKNNISLTRSAGADINQSLGVSNGTDSGIVIRTAGTSRAQIYKYVAGSPILMRTTAADVVKVAIKWNGTSADVFENGVKVVSASSFTTTNMNFLQGSAVDFPKYISAMLLAPTPLTDEQCSILTSESYPTAAAAYASLGLVSESPSCLTSTTTF